MNATISSQSKHHVGSFVTRFAVLLSVAAVLGSAGMAHAGLLYSNGQNINLAAGRATTFSATPGPAAINSAELIQWPAYPGGDYRFGASAAGPGQFTMDFGRVYNVAEYYFNLHSGVFSPGSATYNFQTSTDGVTFTTQQTYSGPTLGAGPDVQVRGTFSAVDARYVRLDLQNWVGYPQFIITKAQVYGNNTGEVTTRGNFSIAQSASNSGVAKLRDRLLANPEQLRPALNDDGEDPTGNFYGKVLTSMRPLPTDPSQVTVELNDSYKVDRVAFTTIADSRSWKDVNVWTSPDASGTNWFQQLTLTNLPANDVYQEFTFAGVQARRVRFDVLNDNQTNTDTYGAEVYVYAAPDSPAILNSNPADGSTILVPYEVGQVGTLTGAVTLTNIGGNGSIVDVEDYTISPGFALLNFDPAQLVVGLDNSISFDISFDPMVAPSPLGLLTLFTSEGELTFQLQASIVPEPSTLALLGLGALGLVRKTRRRRVVA